MTSIPEDKFCKAFYLLLSNFILNIMVQVGISKMEHLRAPILLSSEKYYNSYVSTEHLLLAHHFPKYSS